MKGPELKASYARELKEGVIFRRYATPGDRTSNVDVIVRGRIVDYSAAELIGTIQQGDRKVIIYADDVETDYQSGAPTGLSLPVTTDDKLVIDGKECRIMAPRPRSSIDGVVAAYALNSRGP